MRRHPTGITSIIQLQVFGPPTQVQQPKPPHPGPPLNTNVTAASIARKYSPESFRYATKNMFARGRPRPLLPRHRTTVPRTLEPDPTQLHLVMRQPESLCVFFSNSPARHCAPRLSTPALMLAGRRRGAAVGEAGRALPQVEIPKKKQSSAMGDRCMRPILSLIVPIDNAPSNSNAVCAGSGTGSHPGAIPPAFRQL